MGQELSQNREELYRTVLEAYANPANWASPDELAVEGSPDKCIFRPSGHGWRMAELAIREIKITDEDQ